MSGKLPSALRARAFAWAPVIVKVTGDGFVSEQYSPLPSARPPHCESVGTLVLLLRVKPHAVFSKANEAVTWCTAPPSYASPAVAAPPSLKPLPSPLDVPEPLDKTPLRNAQQ